MTSADDAVPQFRDEFGFGPRVVAGRYAADVEVYFRHPVRLKKVAYTYLFANRLTSIYDPLLALEVFERIHQRHPGSRLLMNAVGELHDDCRSWIAQRGLGAAVEFLTGIKSWSELPAVYQRADILLLPASFSNGNLTILEGMASAGLVVSDRVLGIGRLVEDGRNGFNCEPTADAFVDRIERYIANPEVFKTHAAINRDIVRPMAPEGTARHLARIIEERLA